MLAYKAGRVVRMGLGWEQGGEHRPLVDISNSSTVWIDDQLITRCLTEVCGLPACLAGIVVGNRGARIAAAPPLQACDIPRRTHAPSATVRVELCCVRDWDVSPHAWLAKKNPSTQASTPAHGHHQKLLLQCTTGATTGTPGSTYIYSYTGLASSKSPSPQLAVQWLTPVQAQIMRGLVAAALPKTPEAKNWCVFQAAIAAQV